MNVDAVSGDLQSCQLGRILKNILRDCDEIYLAQEKVQKWDGPVAGRCVHDNYAFAP